MKLLGSRSLQVQLALNLAAVYVIATAVAVIILLYQAYTTADALSKEDLNRRAKHLAVLTIKDDSGSPHVNLPDWLDALYRSGTFLYSVNNSDGQLIAASSGDAGNLVARLPVPSDEPVYFRLRSFGDEKKDYFGLTTNLSSDVGPLRVTIARAAEDDVLVRSLLREFVFNIAWLVPVMVVATLLIGVLAIRRGLLPLRQTSASAAAIEPGTISARLPQKQVPFEIEPLVAAMNDALDRLEKGFIVQRQFTANAAHELRTPLAIVTTALEQLGSTVAVEKLRKDVTRMNRLVEQLLRVARLDALALDTSETVDLSSAARDVVEYLAPVAIANSRSLAIQGTERPVLVKGNRHAIEDAIRNLIENAIVYAPSSSEIIVSVEPLGSVSVTDHGPGVAVEDREHIFERFWRGRGSPGQGSGLGLAIVKEIMKAHHGTIDVHENPGGETVFRLRFQVAKST